MSAVLSVQFWQIITVHWSLFCVIFPKIDDKKYREVVQKDLLVGEEKQLSFSYSEST
jgi:hypothetical protein